LKLHSGIPSINMYQDLLDSELFLEMERYADSFLKEYDFLKDHYSWVKDPFHQWSRQWEYPFIFNCINEYLEDNQNTLVLDAGAGITFSPYLLSELSGVSQVVCQDIDPLLGTLYSRVNKQYKYTSPALSIGQLQNLQFNSDTFDIVYSISVLEHTDNYREIVKEFHRVIKKDGILVLTFDIGLDGVSDISPDKAQELLEFLCQYFQCEDDLAEKITKIISNSKDMLVTSRKIEKNQNNLLPWKHPFLSLIKSAFKNFSVPVKLSKDLTFYCAVFIKK
jgi:ubiquinone/menaquinone biosynthesis C-methylase UbiE